MIVPHWQMTISQVRMPRNLYAMYGTLSSMVPIITPAGIVKSSELRRLNPNPEMIIGIKLETGPFAITKVQVLSQCVLHALRA